jgi:hypothetical protein
LGLWDQSQERFVSELSQEQFKELSCMKSLHCSIVTFCAAVSFGLDVRFVRILRIRKIGDL